MLIHPSQQAAAGEPAILFNPLCSNTFLLFDTGGAKGTLE